MPLEKFYRGVLKQHLHFAKHEFKWMKEITYIAPHTVSFSDESFFFYCKVLKVRVEREKIFHIDLK